MDYTNDIILIDIIIEKNYINYFHYINIQQCLYYIQSKYEGILSRRRFLNSFPDISKWNTNNVKNMSGMFYGCESLNSLPDISKWNTNNVTDMRSMFDECESLKFVGEKYFSDLLVLWKKNKK